VLSRYFDFQYRPYGGSPPSWIFKISGYDPVRGGDRDGGTVGERVGGGRKGPMDGGEREGKERRDGKWRYVSQPTLKQCGKIGISPRYRSTIDLEDRCIICQLLSNHSIHCAEISRLFNMAAICHLRFLARIGLYGRSGGQFANIFQISIKLV